MKNLCTLSLCICITLSSFIASAQETHPLVSTADLSKPKLFNNLPERIRIDANQLSSLLNKQPGISASVTASENQALRFDGSIMSSVENTDSRLKSVMLTLNQFPGARLSITQLTMDDGSVQYAGRILSFQHGDAYVLQKENDTYVFIKKSFSEIINE